MNQKFNKVRNRALTLCFIHMLIRFRMIRSLAQLCILSTISSPTHPLAGAHQATRSWCRIEEYRTVTRPLCKCVCVYGLAVCGQWSAGDVLRTRSACGVCMCRCVWVCVYMWVPARVYVSQYTFHRLAVFCNPNSSSGLSRRCTPQSSTRSYSTSS